MKTGYSEVALRAGAGPSLATALARRGIRAVMLDRPPEGGHASRAAVHARTIELLATNGNSVPTTVIARSWKPKG